MQWRQRPGYRRPLRPWRARCLARRDGRRCQHRAALALARHPEPRRRPCDRLDACCALRRPHRRIPRQDLSVAGPRTGLVPGTRSGLWHHIVTAIQYLRPKLVVIENVRGIYSTRTTAGPLRDVEPCPRCVRDGPGAHLLRALGAVLGSFPTSGWMRRGRCFAPATSGPRTSGHGRSSQLRRPLLKTPTANLGTNGGSQHPEKRKRGGHGPTLADEVENLLPTPRASDGEKGSPNRRYRNGGRTLASTAAALPADTPGRLLPTPTKHDGIGGPGTTPKRRGGMNLRTAVTHLPAGGPSTPRRSDAGKTSRGVPLQAPRSSAPGDCQPSSSSG